MDPAHVPEARSRWFNHMNFSNQKYGREIFSRKE
jgi:hypothetical protein